MKKKLILLLLAGVSGTQIQASWSSALVNNKLIVGVSALGASILAYKLFGKSEDLAATTPQFMNQKETVYAQIAQENLNTLVSNMHNYSSGKYPVATYVERLSDDLKQLDKRYEATEDKALRERIINLKNTLISLKKVLMSSTQYSNELDKIYEDKKLQEERDREDLERYHQTQLIESIAKKSAHHSENVTSQRETSNSSSFETTSKKEPSLSGADYKECMKASQTFFGGPFAS